MFEEEIRCEKAVLAQRFLIRRNLSLDNLEKIAAGLRTPIPELFPKGRAVPKRKDSLDDFLGPMAGLVRDRPRGDRECILDVARAVARRLKFPRRG